MTAPLSGAELARAFHADVVAPLLARAMPRLRYAAARLGSGSDVLGYDDAMSRDHDWGCRLTVLTDTADRAALSEVMRLLERELPGSYRGLPVRFDVSWDRSGSHRVQVATVSGFALSTLGVDPTAPLTPPDWLILTGQSVLELTAGPVFADSTAELAPVRERLAWYPADVELFVLAAGWRRLAQEMPFVGRTAQRGDETGSRLLSAQLAGDLMMLGFLLSRRWPPYSKWRGTAFGTLEVAGELAGPLAEATAAPGWRDREGALARACEILLDAQRARGLPAPAPAVIPFFDRPYRGVDNAVCAGLLSAITDPVLAVLPPIGSVEQWVANVDMLAYPQRRAALRTVYAAASGAGAAGVTAAAGDD